MKAWQSESQMQIDVFNVLRFNERADPYLRWVYAVPNGSARHPAVGAKLKAEGVKKGISDLCCPFPSFQNMGVSHGAYIELKAGRNKPTAEQAEFLEFVNANGYSTAVVYSADDALDFIENYCGIKLIR